MSNEEGKTLEEGKTVEPNKRLSPPTIANPAPLGLSAFALTTFVLSLNNAGAPTIPLPDVVIGLALFYGGLAQLLAGMWEFKTGNTFGATAFSSYGAFWLSFASIHVFKLGDAYKALNETDPFAFQHSVGIYLLGWTIFTFICFLATFRSTGGIMALFFSLTITFFLLALGHFFLLEVGAKGPNGLVKAGGVFGVITALIAWYNALAGLLTPESAYFSLPTFDLNRRKRD